MALFREADLRYLAKARASNLNESTSSILQKSLNASAGLTAFHIFLSHSYLDKELIVGIALYLESLGYRVYVDWREDTQLNRDNVTKETAEVVRGRITQSQSLFFATTESAKSSRWMPWELGYMDGKKGKSAILPISQGDGGDSYRGQEYLGIYPYITNGKTVGGQEKLWVHEDAKKYVHFDAWLRGEQPTKHE